MYGIMFYALAVGVTFIRIKDAMMNDPEFQELVLPFVNPVEPPNPMPLILPGIIPVIHWIFGFALIYICTTEEGWNMLKKELAKKNDDLKK